MPTFYRSYADRLSALLAGFDWGCLMALTRAVEETRLRAGRIFLCGNGGSAANAVHIANDLLYAPVVPAVRADALSANIALVTCIANDVAYEEIFARQLAAQAGRGDLLIALSGSGDSENIVRAIDRARALGAKSAAIVGFDGGRARELADVVVHFPVDDMQLAEDLQLVVGHMLARRLARGGGEGG
ncbi:MAG: SIS domain-containing protein [Zetaproteobacteria bacterium]|nr:MAG: SIS domain-containing protein [Zetaproteobacteria bacterium]